MHFSLKNLSSLKKILTIREEKIPSIRGQKLPRLRLASNPITHLCDKDDDFPSSLSSGSPHSLDKADRGFGHIVANDQVNFADIQAFLSDASGHEGIEATLFETTDDFKLLLLCQPLLH